VLVLLLPIIFLVYAVIKPHPIRSTVSLGLSATMMFFLKLAYLSSNPLIACASVIKGCLQALVPVSIVAGAIFLFDAMESARCLAWMRIAMKKITNDHPVAEVMLIGWAFHFVVEGASGFGTPACLAVPILYSMGHPKLESVCCLLLFNGFSAVFGAVGTPLWFGIGQAVGASEDMQADIGFRASLAVTCNAVLLVPLVVNLLVPKADVIRNLVFIECVVVSTMVPYVGVAYFSAEFPTLIGGVVAIFATGILIQFKVGLKPMQKESDPPADADKLEAGQAGAEAGNGGGDQREAAAPQETREGEGEPAAPETKPASESPRRVDSMDMIEGGVFDDRRGVPEPTEDDAEAKSAPAEAQSAPAGLGGVLASQSEATVLSAPDNIVSHPSITAQLGAKGWHLDHEAMYRLKHDQGAAMVAPASIYGKMKGRFLKSATIRLTNDSHADLEKQTSPMDVALRLMPLWLTVVLLVLTRIKPIGLKELLTETEDSIFDTQLGSLAQIKLSTSLVIQISDILSTPNDIGWTYELLYIPFLVPFFVAGFATLFVYRKELETPLLDILSGLLSRLKNPLIALLGALILVELLRSSDEVTDAPANIIGLRLSNKLSHAFVLLSALLGSLGAFFSGSTTISNLTFGAVQQAAAVNLDISLEALLAVQACGASVGNAVCLANIIAVSTVVGMESAEGAVIKRIFPIFLAYCGITTLVMLPFMYA